MITLSLCSAILITIAVLASLIWEDYKFNKSVSKDEETDSMLRALFGVDYKNHTDPK